MNTSTAYLGDDHEVIDCMHGGFRRHAADDCCHLCEPRVMDASQEADDGPPARAVPTERRTWIRLCTQELMILRTGMPGSECEAWAARMWGSCCHLGPMTAAALIDRMLDRHEG